MINNVIKNPENYAAIYARISSKKENNSIEAQKQLGEEIISQNNLLLYDTYTDHISGRRTAPHERPGFKKLLDAAKANCFKTLVIYRLDRLVRSYTHWIEIKNTLEKLGVKIIFSDTKQALPSSSPYRDFLENLTVMVAELEPDTINLRASTGRRIQRENGIYTTKTAAFGYTKKVVKNKYGKNETIFLSNFVQIDFVNYIYLKYYSLIINEKTEFEDNVSFSQIYVALKSTIEYIEDKLTNSNTIPLSSLPNDELCEKKLYEKLNHHIKELGIDKVKKEISCVKNNFLVKENGASLTTTNITNCLTTTTYAGLMLLDTQHPCSGLKYDGENPETFEKVLDKSAFIEINNLEKAVEYEVFKAVYEHITYKKLLNEDRTPNYLLKNKIKCSCNQTLHLINNSYLHCGNADCPTFLKEDLLRFILGEIIIDSLNQTPNSLYNAINKLQRKVNVADENIKFYELNKFKAVNEYLTIDDSSSSNIIKHVGHIKTLHETCNAYRNQLAYLTQLNEEISSIGSKNSNEESTSLLLDKFKNKVIDYIFSREDLFIPIFNELIKEIKVGVVQSGRNVKGTLRITYTVTT